MNACGHALIGELVEAGSVDFTQPNLILKVIKGKTHEHHKFYRKPHDRDWET